MTDQTSRPLALVTGASSGIGRELAREFATNGFDLVIAAEDERIGTVAEELRGLGAEVIAVQVDLTTDRGVDNLISRAAPRGRVPDAAALNAGIGAGGAFATDTALEDELRIVDLNVRSTVHLAKHLVADMVARGSGRILFTSSIASTMPGTYQAVYNASKSFVQSFALALREELKDTGVTVTALMPGPTDTEFFERADMLDTKVGAGDKDDPRDVARDGFEALMAGEERIISASLKTKLQGRGSRLLPDSVKAKMHAAQARPGSGEGPEGNGSAVPHEYDIHEKEDDDMGKTARDVMSGGAECVGENETVLDAARKLADLGVGAMPICGEDDRLKGMLTDRDIVVKVLAKGKDPEQTRAGETADGSEVVTIGADDSVEDALRTMASHKVRRLPVIDGHRLVGVVSQADLARSLDNAQVGELVEAISATA